jgi:hypothetical protein
MGVPSKFEGGGVASQTVPGQKLRFILQNRRADAPYTSRIEIIGYNKIQTQTRETQLIPLFRVRPTDFRG